ncbi:major facilitator superfamily domain-containing protein [Aspergillus caelatus]|uniref:Major facilitator superfamily domain-containing protein n=1 Tax=Aspergillus caelatus TaxID=61420 RepID=A0A5N7AKJ5_9EURO|nr:major facilitator superfamily domain-containing protein [Aspergillus caelatus]KAE8370233.1 major facilitator superfamily domain-containing protein [Aspergillus caelatus]
MTSIEESHIGYGASLEKKQSGLYGKGRPLMVTEKEAFARARNSPEEALPLCITFSHNDRENPRCWPKWRKWYITIMVSMLNVITTWCAGSISSGAPAIQSEFGVSGEVTTLCLSLYVLGYAVGPVLLAPLSEYFGRQPVYVVSWFLLFIFQLPIALAPNIGTIIVCRFIAGFAGGAPLTNTGGSISGLWERNTSGGPMAIYGLSSTFGPPMALVVSGYMALDLGWRWIFWIMMAITGGWWVLLVLTVPETRHTIILQRKAQRVRKSMQKENLRSAETITDASASGRKGLDELFKITLTRPFRFLFTEPITTFSAIYNGFLYGLVYLFNEAFPLVFGPGKGHGFNVGQQGLTFLGMAIGPIIAFCFYPLQERYYLRWIKENDDKGVPEARMWMARLGAILIPISLFWFGWTSYRSVHWIVPIIASAFFGAGIYIVILSILNYVVDSYQTYSASALAGVILVRNLVGAGFPLFATQMYERLGYEWASSLLGFLAILLVPIPFIFFYMGRAIRLRSPWAREHFEQNEDTPH